MKKIFKPIFLFISGLPFAISLLSLLSLFVIGGTILESLTKSHLRATTLIFQNPLFLLLYGALFLNVLFSLIQRYPFRIRHIPLICSHLGVLLVLTELIVSGLCGSQGWIYLREGESKKHYAVLNEPAIHLQCEGGIYSYPVKNKKLLFKNRREDPVHLNLVRWIPNGIENTSAWFHGDKLLIEGLPPLPVHEGASRQLNWQRVQLANNEHWDILAVRTRKGEPLQLQKREGTPALVFIQTEEGENKLTLFKKKGGAVVIPLSNEYSSYVSFDEGYKGYGVQLQIPAAQFGEGAQELKLYSPLAFSYTPLPLNGVLEENTPLVELEVIKGSRKEYPILVYDEMGSGFHKPIVGGEYLLSFEPMRRDLPFELSFLEGRIGGFEGVQCDLKVDCEGQKPLIRTLSLNHVLKMPGGYKVCLMDLKKEGVLLSILQKPLQGVALYMGIFLIGLGLLWIIFQKRSPPRYP